jgi:hypothetical protein
MLLLVAVVEAATSSARVEMPTRSWCLDTVVGWAVIGDGDWHCLFRGVYFEYSPLELVSVGSDIIIKIGFRVVLLFVVCNHIISKQSKVRIFRVEPWALSLSTSFRGVILWLGQSPTGFNSGLRGGFAHPRIKRLRMKSRLRYTFKNMSSLLPDRNRSVLYVCY